MTILLNIIFLFFCSEAFSAPAKKITETKKLGLIHPGEISEKVEIKKPKHGEWMLTIVQPDNSIESKIINKFPHRVELAKSGWVCRLAKIPDDPLLEWVLTITCDKDKAKVITLAGAGAEAILGLAENDRPDWLWRVMVTLGE